MSDELFSAPVSLAPHSPRQTLSPKQKAVIEHCHVVGRITSAQAVELIGRNIYANAGKHVGATLGNMVKRGLLRRVQPGVFVLKRPFREEQP